MQFQRSNPYRSRKRHELKNSNVCKIVQDVQAANSQIATCAAIDSRRQRQSHKLSMILEGEYMEATPLLLLRLPPTRIEPAVK